MDAQKESKRFFLKFFLCERTTTTERNDGGNARLRLKMQISVEMGGGAAASTSSPVSGAAAAVMEELNMSSVLTAPAVNPSTAVPPSSAALPSPSSETLVQLCKLWKHIHEDPPPTPPTFCPDILQKFYLRQMNSVAVYDDRFRYQTHRHSVTSDDLMVGIDSMNELTFTGRSLSLLAVLGGVLFILLVVAFVTCIKHRKRIRDEEGDGLSLDILSSQLRQMHQARASQQLLSMLSSLPELPSAAGAGPAPPPDYETVVKLTKQKEDQDLPSYIEATGGGQDEDTNAIHDGREGLAPSTSQTTRSQVSQLPQAGADAQSD